MSGSRALYTALAARLTELSHLRSVSALLSWDQAVMMPGKGAESRSAQSSALAGIVHERETSVELGELLARVEASLASHSGATLTSKKTESSVSETPLNIYEKATVRDARRNFDRESRVPAQLSKRMAELQSSGYVAWVSARESDSWESFSPVLSEWVEVVRQLAHHVDPEKTPYDVALDRFERGLTTARLDAVFATLKAGILPLIQRIREKGWQPQDDFLQNKAFDIDAQKAFNVQLVKDLGFDMEAGRLDVSVHPFTCSISPTDVRMTTRYKPDNLVEGITGSIHECGHSLYEQGLNKDHVGLPVADALSMGIHESQSLLWERMVGLSLPFWTHYHPILLKTFPKITPPPTPSTLYAALNKVVPGLIRVESDEVTYAAHILLRYEIERDLINGILPVSAVPSLWNEKMKSYLGVSVPDNKTGCLQDVHWSSGLFGYFPTYTLGAIYAHQFFNQARKDIPDLETQISNGHFLGLKTWLNTNVHKHGSLYPSGDELCVKVTGKPLDADGFVKYLETKYSKIYDL